MPQLSYISLSFFYLVDSIGRKLYGEENVYKMKARGTASGTNGKTARLVARLDDTMEIPLQCFEESIEA